MKNYRSVRLLPAMRLCLPSKQDRTLREFSMAKSPIEIDEELLSRASHVLDTNGAGATVSAALAEAVERERPMPAAAPADMSFLRPAISADFVGYVWDENGHF